MKEHKERLDFIEKMRRRKLFQKYNKIEKEIIEKTDYMIKNKIKVLIKKHGLALNKKNTLKTCAEDLEMSYQNLIRVLGPNGKISMDLIFKLCLYTNTKISYFFEEIEELFIMYFEEQVKKDEELNGELKRIKNDYEREERMLNEIEERKTKVIDLKNN